MWLWWHSTKKQEQMPNTSLKWECKDTNLMMQCRPGFSQDRVNFHQNPEWDTARLADPKRLNKTGYLIPCAVMLCSGGGAVWGEVSHGSGARRASCGGSRSVHLAICFVYSSYQYYYCFYSLHFLFCWTALIPTHEFLPFFLSILIPNPVRGGATERPSGPLLPATVQNYNKCSRNCEADCYIHYIGWTMEF